MRDTQTKRIIIESIFGGHSPSTHFARTDQFRGSLGIDPAQPIKDLPMTAASLGASGLLRPVGSQKISSTTITNPPLWIKPTPKSSSVFVYDSVGSAYTFDVVSMTVTALSDAGTLSSSSGNGMEYYDNYIYFAKNTDIARYGPLNGSAGFNPSFWQGTLSKGALEDTTYLKDTRTNLFGYPNHPMHRHSDGILYIGDVQGNLGTIHTIKTTKGSVEGDTDNGSTINKLQFGYGLWPTALESYGSDLAIALFEGSSTGGVRQMPAKIAFWDTNSQNFNKITWVEFPVSVITAMKNINGVLYVFSSNIYMKGFRVTRFIGGYTFEEVGYFEQGQAPFPGSVDGNSQRLLVGSWADTPESSGCVFSLMGLSKSSLSKGMFNVMRSTGGTAATVTALSLLQRTVSGNTDFNFYTPVIGWSAGLASGTTNGIDSVGTQYNNAPSVWWSQMFRVGQRFKITKIRLPLATPVGTNMTLIAKIYTDDGAGDTFTYQTINDTNYTKSEKNIVLRADASASGGQGGVLPEGFHNFWLELRWSGSALCVVGLPIIIEYELQEDDA